MVFFWRKKEKEKPYFISFSLVSSLALFPICLGKAEGSTKVIWGLGLAAQSGSALNPDTHTGFLFLGGYSQFSLHWSCLDIECWDEGGETQMVSRHEGHIGCAIGFASRLQITLSDVALLDGEVQWHWRSKPKFLSKFPWLSTVFHEYVASKAQRVRDKWRADGRVLIFHAGCLFFCLLRYVL